MTELFWPGLAGGGFLPVSGNLRGNRPKARRRLTLAGAGKITKYAFQFVKHGISLSSHRLCSSGCCGLRGSVLLGVLPTKQHDPRAMLHTLKFSRPRRLRGQQGRRCAVAVRVHSGSQGAQWQSGCAVAVRLRSFIMIVMIQRHRELLSHYSTLPFPALHSPHSSHHSHGIRHQRH